MDETPVMRVPVGVDVNTVIHGPTAGLPARRPEYAYISLRWASQHSEAASKEAGTPVFDKVLMLRHVYPGTQDTLDVAVKAYPTDGDPVVLDEGRTGRFREVIEKFEAGAVAADAGQPLALMNLDPAVIDTLGAVGVKTIEQLADVPDSALQGLRTGGRAIRDRARAYLDAQSGGTAITKVQAENDTLRADIVEIKRQFDELKAQVATTADDAGKSKKGG